jgi:hypothetical protein
MTALLPRRQDSVSQTNCRSLFISITVLLLLFGIIDQKDRLPLPPMHQTLEPTVLFPETIQRHSVCQLISRLPRWFFDSRSRACPSQVYVCVLLSTMRNTVSAGCCLEKVEYTLPLHCILDGISWVFCRVDFQRHLITSGNPIRPQIPVHCHEVSSHTGISGAQETNATTSVESVCMPSKEGKW